MTDEEKLVYWSKFHQKLRDEKARKQELYGPGYQKRRERNWDIITFGTIRRAGERVAEVVQGLVQQTDVLFDKLSEKLGARVFDTNAIDRSVEPTLTIDAAQLYAADDVASLADNSKQAAEGLGQLYYDQTDLATAIANVRTASWQVTQVQEPKTMAVVLANNTVAHIHGFSSFEEILGKIEYGFPENELPELLNLLRSQREGVEEVSSVFAHQLFYRASVRFVERCMDPAFSDGPERDRLLYFALAIKGLRPDVDQDDLFDKIYDGVYEHLQREEAKGTQFAQPVDKLNVISMFDRIRERHVKDAMRAATDAPEHGPDDSIAPLAPTGEANARLAEGYEQLPVADGGLASSSDGKVVPFRPAPPKSKPEDPNGSPKT